MREKTTPYCKTLPPERAQPYGTRDLPKLDLISNSSADGGDSLRSTLEDAGVSLLS
jgi:hypothetical protein